MATTTTNKLAIDGGKKILSTPLPVWPQFDRRTPRRVLEILHSGRVNYWTGSIGHEFESAFAAWLGCKHAVSVTNGTAALHVALAALGIGAGDEVICTPYSFIASSFCALQAGAMPVFCDVGMDHLMDAAKIEALITPRTKAIVVVHLYGIVAEMSPILKIAKRHHLAVIEDCAQCLGGVYEGHKVGTLGTIGCFSFCQSKHFTTAGEGGMVCTNSAALAKEIRALRDHGREEISAAELQDGRDFHPYTYRRVGYNLRMTEIQSAVGLGELKRLDTWNLPRRAKLAHALIQGLAHHPLIRVAPIDTQTRKSSFWLVPFVLRSEFLRVPVSHFIRAVQAEGVGAYAILWPIMYKEPVFTQRGGFAASNYPFDDSASTQIDYSKVDCPVAQELAANTIGFWVHPTYSLQHIRAAIRAFNKVYNAYKR